MPIYLDNNATTRPGPDVVAAVMRSFETGWANPSSTHGAGQIVSRAVEAARRQVASLGSVSPEQVIFTSGATEANEAVLRHHAALGFDLVTSEAEHPAVTGFFARHAPERCHVVPLDEHGRWDLEQLEVILQRLSRHALVAFSWANGETGVLQDAHRIAQVATAHGVSCLVDATQAIGRIEVQGGLLQHAYLTFSAHKLHGPKGVGVLILPTDGESVCLAVGGGQEGGRRGGTVNVPGILGMGAACDVRARNFGPHVQHLAALRDRFERQIVGMLDGVRINGLGAPRVPNTSNLSFHAVDGMALVARLEERGILCSQVSACSSGLPEPSRTLLAMGLSSQEAFASVRFAVSVDNTAEEIDAASQALVEEVCFIREMMGGLV